MQSLECESADEVMRRAREIEKRKREQRNAPPPPPKQKPVSIYYDTRPFSGVTPPPPPIRIEPPPPIASAPIEPPPPEPKPREPRVLPAFDPIPDEDLHIKIEDILRSVARHFGVTVIDILSDRRPQYIVRPRQVSMFLCRELTKRSLPEIARRHGGRDHTTALHGVRTIEKLRLNHPIWDERVTVLTEQLRTAARQAAMNLKIEKWEKEQDEWKKRQSN